jgi:ATP-binding cassette subfamily C (CFTR/MRP) protein 1
MYPANYQGSVQVVGRIAYVGQQAWIMNATLRDNILFSKPYDRKLYERTIAACGLKPDIDILSAGDMTEIGERGINLSGGLFRQAHYKYSYMIQCAYIKTFSSFYLSNKMIGQRQRVSLARAVYAQADIYLLDDPLSAVDAHVGRHIFDQVIGPRGMLKSKARLFVTHAIQYIPECDRVMILSQGEIVEGPERFKHLVEKKGDVFFLVREFISELEATMSTDEDLQVRSPNLESLNELAAAAEVELSTSLKSNLSLMSGKSRKPSLPPVPNNFKSETAQTKSTGNLMTKEDSAQGSVNFSVYRTYLLSCSLAAVITVICIMLFAQGLSVGSNVWLKIWSSASENNDGNVAFYLGVYGFLSLVSVVCIFVQMSVLFVVCANRSSRMLHKDLLYTTLRSPMSFFDTTPLGRVVNRFSRDIHTVDEVLPRSFKAFLRTSLNVFTTVVVICVSTPLFLALILPMGVLYYFIQRYYICTLRELKRLDSVSRSPICKRSIFHIVFHHVDAHFSETLGGVSTIRAYNLTDVFQQENQRRVDVNLRAYYPCVASNRWYVLG